MPQLVLPDFVAGEIQQSPRVGGVSSEPTVRNLVSDIAGLFQEALEQKNQCHATL